MNIGHQFGQLFESTLSNWDIPVCRLVIFLINLCRPNWHVRACVSPPCRKLVVRVSGAPGLGARLGQIWTPQCRALSLMGPDERHLHTPSMSKTVKTTNWLGHLFFNHHAWKIDFGLCVKKKSFESFLQKSIFSWKISGTLYLKHLQHNGRSKNNKKSQCMLSPIWLLNKWGLGCKNYIKIGCGKNSFFFLPGG